MKDQVVLVEVVVVTEARQDHIVLAEQEHQDREIQEEILEEA
jgi:hypothetical protein